MRFTKRLLQYAALMYLGFAGIGAFAFSAIDGSFLETGSEHPLFLTAGDSYIDCPAVSSGKYTPPARHSLPRMIMPQILLAACAGLICGAVKAITKTIPKTIKNTIILKLRI
ncbi:MAG: hypothetical protein LBG90_07915 [Spirochaetaceae bacterium]|jgi:hypothetical protein|nr:hypothetical protein [Spirochaetaceae bacterium]